ncbi:MAG: LysM peptidoglycan-binding domain-containing protein [Streptosporangiaceae bacterium]
MPSGPGAQRPVRPWADARQSVRPLPSVPVLSGAVVTAPGRAGLRPARRPGLRLTRRGRIVLAVLAVLAVCGLFVAGASAAQASGPAAAHGAPGTAEQVIVQPGDSLWSIAQSADPNADARAIVQEILQANRLKTVNLTAGQRLWVPRG